MDGEQLTGEENRWEKNNINNNNAEKSILRYGTLCLFFEYYFKEIDLFLLKTGHMGKIILIFINYRDAPYYSL
jgi:hypothetical protein